MERKAEIAIIGGGIGGLAAALALGRASFACRVYERAAELTDIGGGLNLGPNALKTFRMLGVEDAMIAAGCQDDFQTTRNGATGAVMTKMPRRAGVVEKYGATFLTIHRADVQNILREALPEGVLHLSKVCTGVETLDGRARATFADGSSIETDAVIGADGIHSVVREALFGKQPPRFTGCICFRGLVPVEDAAHISGARDMTGWWGPHGHVVQYRVNGGKMINFVAHYDSDAWTEESWIRECSREEVLDTFSGWHEDLRKLLALGDKHYKWALYDREPLEQWGRGRITLLGDAVYPMLPYMGQGAAMALEDACMLARAFETHAGDVEAALRLYEGLRQPRKTKVVLASRARAKEFHLSSPLARLWRDIKLAIRSRFGADKSTLRADWVYHYDVASALLDPARERAEHAPAIRELQHA